MTVCIAAICDDASIVGASDRMITAGDVEYEPPQTKVVSLTTSIAVMIAGDAALQTEILIGLRDQVKAAVDANPTQWLSVQTIADWYFQKYQLVRNNRIEQAILSPLGLNRQTFVTQQVQLQPQLVTRLASEMVNYVMPEIEIIIAGVDATGPHIFVVDNDDVKARDSVGFAAIGAGYWHANSQFMFSEYARWKPMPEVLFLTYAAKRRAEVAPGVGEGTDMFMIGPQLGSFFTIGDHVLKSLGIIYEKTRRSALKSRKQALLEVNKYVEELGRKSQEAAIIVPPQAATPALPDAGGADDKKPESDSKAEKNKET